MLALIIKGQLLPLKAGTSISLEINNPIFDNEIIRGSYSLSFSLPISPESGNRQKLGWPSVLDSVADVQREFECSLLSDGEEIKGLLKVREINDPIASVNLQLGISAIGRQLKEKKLSEFTFGGERVLGADTAGVLAHMAATVANPDEFDYIFAPYQNNNAHGPKEPAEGQPAASLVVNEYSRGFLPADSSVFFSTDLFARSICPLPYLKYVLLSIFRELNVRVQDNFFDAELSKLVILSNVLLSETEVVPEIHPWKPYNVYRRRFKLGEVLPDMTVIDLLKKIAASFGLTIQVGLNNSVLFEKLQDIVNSPTYDDWTEKASAAVKQEIAEPEGFTLKYTHDSNDEALKTYVQEINPGQVKPAVGSLAFLPYQPGAEDIRLVRDLNQYYKYSTEKGSWEYYSENYPDLPVHGGGSELSQGHALLLDRTVPYNFLVPTQRRLPFMNLEAYDPAYGFYTKTEQLRLAFYRGLQPDSAGNLYPQLSADNRNLPGAKTGEYSLRLEGEAGTYENFFKDWLRFKNKKRIVRRRVSLTMLDLANLNLNQKKDIGGIRYLVKKISITLPIRKPADVELWKI